MAGWQVVRAVEQIEVLTAVRGQNVDLVLLHVPVDEVIDLDLAEVLRQVAPSEYLPVVILTEDPADQQRCRYLDSGADDVIAQTVSPQELVSRVGALLRVKELSDQLSDSRRALQNALQRERKLLSKLKRDNAQLQQLCTTDPLTHLQNVRSFRDILVHEFKIAKRYNQPLSILMLDVDHFKIVNDTHGHPSGDYVLKELAVILTQSVRESDVVARTGGEEFSVVLPKADREHAMQFAERIRQAVGDRDFEVYAQHIHVTTSIGLATFPVDAEITDSDLLVYCADQALLMAKDSGRDRVIPFCQLDPAVRQRLRRQHIQMLQHRRLLEPEDTPHDLPLPEPALPPQ